jgi:hypothetical protein
MDRLPNLTLVLFCGALALAADPLHVSPRSASQAAGLNVAHPELPGNVFDFRTCEAVLDGNRDFGLFRVNLALPGLADGPAWFTNNGGVGYQWRYPEGVEVRFTAKPEIDRVVVSYTILNHTPAPLERVHLHTCVTTTEAPSFFPPLTPRGESTLPANSTDKDYTELLTRLWDADVSWHWARLGGVGCRRIGIERQDVARGLSRLWPNDVRRCIAHRHRQMHPFPSWNLQEPLHTGFIEPTHDASAQPFLHRLKAEMFNGNSQVHERIRLVLEHGPQSGGHCGRFRDHRHQHRRLGRERVDSKHRGSHPLGDGRPELRFVNDDELPRLRIAGGRGQSSRLDAPFNLLAFDGSPNEFACALPLTDQIEERHLGYSCKRP